ncbi:MAG: FecR family protein [Myxococcota bacterium]|nr:FecR family protein [Myxococcota bacterium]
MSPDRETPTLRALTEDAVDEARLNDNWRAIAARRRTSPPRRAGWKVAGALAAAAAVALFVLGREDAPEALTLVDGGAFDRVEGPVVDLSDGSRLQLGADADLEVLESSGQRVALRLAHGVARFEVTPGGPRRWVIEAGARVEVVGTVFTVRRDGDRVDVEVERGVVLVRHEDLDDGVTRLTAGESVRVGDTEPLALAGEAADAPREGTMVDEPAADEAAADEAAADEAAADEAAANEAAADEAAADEAAADEAAADEATPVHAEQALVEAEPAPPRPSTRRPRGPSADALWERADAARAGGDPSDAAAALRRLLAEHPRDARSAMAAVTLGRLALRRLDQPAEAAEALARALALGLPGALAEDARAMRVEALTRAGRATEARAAAAEYHDRHPDGRWAEQVTHWAPASSP